MGGVTIVVSKLSDCTSYWQHKNKQCNEPKPPLRHFRGHVAAVPQESHLAREAKDVTFHGIATEQRPGLDFMRQDLRVALDEAHSKASGLEAW